MATNITLNTQLALAGKLLTGANTGLASALHHQLSTTLNGLTAKMWCHRFKVPALR